MVRRIKRKINIDLKGRIRMRKFIKQQMRLGGSKDFAKGFKIGVEAERRRRRMR